jgi:F-type H+-transporting ATPase subunit gamma
VEAGRPYAGRIAEVLARLAPAAVREDHPLFQVREVKRTALVLITGDRGLCGAYNANLIRAAEHRLRESPPGSLVLLPVGRRGRDYFRRRQWPLLEGSADPTSEGALANARDLAADLIERFTRGEVDRVEINFTRFVSALTRQIVTEVFLPVGGARADGPEPDGDVIFEPDARAVFAELLPRYATARLSAAVAEALASEQSARMVAMGAARRNAGELLDLLVLQRNRARQSTITKELLEIVAGAEALR